MLNLFGDYLRWAVIILHAAWVICAAVAYVKWRRANAVGDTPQVPVGQAQPGMEASFQGVAAFAGSQLLSTLGNVPAVWHDWQVERREIRRGTGSSGDSESWRREEHGQSEEPFALDDGAGKRILVWPRHAQVDGTSSNSWYSAMPRAGKSVFGDSMLGAGINALSMLSGGGNYRFTEHYLEPGIACFVMGRLDPPRPEDGAGVLGIISRGSNRAFYISTGTPAGARSALRWDAVVMAMIAVGILAGALYLSIEVLSAG